MPSPKSHRRGCPEKNMKRSSPEKAPSFNGRDAGVVTDMLMPRTVPDLLTKSRACRNSAAATVAPPPKLTKLLVNVTIQRSPGPVHVLVTPEDTVRDLIFAALREYGKEARRPVLSSADASAFDLHYSQFTLQSLNREEKVVELGSRNFFLCPRNTAAQSGGAFVGSRCSEEAAEGSKEGLPWLKFMDLLL